MRHCWIVALLVACVTAPARALAEVELGFETLVANRYIWRGIDVVNRPVLQPAFWVTRAFGPVELTVGTWASVEIGSYGADDDVSENGGKAFDVSELEPYVSLDYTLLEKATFTLAFEGYLYPNHNGVTWDENTGEASLGLALDVLLSPSLGVWYDVGDIGGAYLEASVGHEFALSERFGLALGATAGFSLSQGEQIDGDGSVDAGNFASDGFTHAELSASLPITHGSFQVAPSVHLVYAHDDWAKYTSATRTSDFKAWFGLTFSTSRSFGSRE